MMLFLVFQHKSRKTVRYQKLNYKGTFIVLNEYRYTRFLSFCLFFNFFLSLEIRLNSVVKSKQSVDQKQLPHFASRIVTPLLPTNTLGRLTPTENGGILSSRHYGIGQYDSRPFRTAAVGNDGCAQFLRNHPLRCLVALGVTLSVSAALMQVD